jgi:short-chain Z-isoprenyl diphosphate synthase
LPATTIFTRPLYRLYERGLLRALDHDRLPRHIGVILDGHRRHAKAERLPDYQAAYQAGADKMIQFLGWTDEIGIEAVTCWLLSTENLHRPDQELEPLIDVLTDLLDRLPTALGEGVEARVIGSLDLLPPRLRDAAKRLEEKRPRGDRRVTVALGYGGRQEIVDAARDLVGKLVDEGVAVEDIEAKIDADGLASHMYTSDIPDPDLVIRTSGEARLSGFLLWQSAYAEFSFVDVYWPVFRRVDFLRTLRDFVSRDRRFGR